MEGSWSVSGVEGESIQPERPKASKSALDATYAKSTIAAKLIDIVAKIFGRPKNSAGAELLVQNISDQRLDLFLSFFQRPFDILAASRIAARGNWHRDRMDLSAPVLKRKSNGADSRGVLV